MNASRRLSDIGEEMSPARSEGFDDVGSSQQQRQQQQRLGLRGSPLLRTQLAAAELHDSANMARSSSSSSTVSARSWRASGEASSPQAAPESTSKPDAVESGGNTGSGSVDGVKIATGLPDSSIVASAAKGKGPGEEFSSAILSSEAERILENAKKRLTVCGNLSWQR